MPGTRSSAATKCISDVPGLEKQVSTPLAEQRMDEGFRAVHGGFPPAAWDVPSSADCPPGRSRGNGGLRGASARATSSSQHDRGGRDLDRLYPESNYPDDSVERRIFGPDVRVLVRDTRTIAELSDARLRRADGLMILRQRVSAADLRGLPACAWSAAWASGYEASTAKPRPSGRSWSATCRITAPRRWPITPSRWSWRFAGGCCCTMNGSGGSLRRPGKPCSTR